LSSEELIPFNYFKPASLSIKQEYETPYLPTGFIFKFQLLTNWGDNDQIGLNGIAFYDQLNRLIFDYSTPKIVFYPINNQNIHNEINNTIRTNNITNNITNLLNPINNKKVNSWETNYINKNLSNFNNQEDSIEQLSLYLVFDQPITISKIHISNYSINPTIGLKDFILFCDDSIIYKVI